MFVLAGKRNKSLKMIDCDDFAKKTYKTPNGDLLRYRIYLPEKIDKKKKYPLVIFFHGAGERGKDNIKQLKHGVKQILAFTKKYKKPAIIIVPQCPKKQQWVDTPWRDDSHTMPKEPSHSMKLAMAMMKEVMTNQPIDQKRIYVTGISMGGFGTWDIIQRMPETFAAAVPICGGGDVKQAENIKDIPLWAFHGDKDTIVKTKRSRDMISAIKAAGGKPKYTEYKGVKHSPCWIKAYSDEKIFKWLFKQQKK